jgi:hypothetical protein
VEVLTLLLSLLPLYVATTLDTHLLLLHLLLLPPLLLLPLLLRFFRFQHSPCSQNLGPWQQLACQTHLANSLL